MKVKAKADDYTIAIQKDEYSRMFTEKRTPEQIRSQVDEIRKHYDFFKQINSERLEPGETTTVIYGKDSSGNYSQFHVIHRCIQDIDRKEREKGYIYISLNECIHSWYLLSLIGIADYTLYDILELPPIPSEYASAISSAAIGMFHRLNNKIPIEQDINGQYAIKLRTESSEIDLKSLSPFDPAIQMFFDILTIKYAEQHAKAIKLTVSEYMRIRNLKQRVKATEQYKKAVEDLTKISYSSVEKIRGKFKTTGITCIIQKICKNESGYITGVLLSDDMYKYCKYMENQILLFPLALFQLDIKRDIYAYQLGYRLCYLDRIQAGSPNQNHHILVNVLESCGFMDIAESNKKFSRIRDNLQKALEKLIDIGVLQRYEITDRDGNKQDVNTITAFDGLYLDVTTTTPADKEQHLIDKRQQRAASVQKAKQKALETSEKKKLQKKKVSKKPANIQ